MSNWTFNGIYQVALVIGFICLLIKLTRDQHKAHKAQGRLKRITDLLKKAKTTNDENMVDETRKEIFKILEKKL